MRLFFAKSDHVVTQKLVKLIQEKSSNLAFSVNITDSRTLLKVIKHLADTIVILKTYIDIVSDFTSSLKQKLKTLADKAGFLTLRIVNSLIFVVLHISK